MYKLAAECQSSHSVIGYLSSVCIPMYLFCVFGSGRSDDSSFLCILICWGLDYGLFSVKMLKDRPRTVLGDFYQLRVRNKICWQTFMFGLYNSSNLVRSTRYVFSFVHLCVQGWGQKRCRSKGMKGQIYLDHSSQLWSRLWCQFICMPRSLQIA